VYSLRDPRHAQAICEEYRAAATIDREHDRSDRASRRRTVCPLLILWSAHGALENWYVGEGRPIALWRVWSDEVRGRELNTGHFFPEEAPEQTTEALNCFFAAAKSS
jgi:haloacetate dehalogenase